MISGRLRRTVTIRRRSSSKNTLGEFVETYTTVATRRASVEPINGREYWAQSGEHSEVTTRIRLRYDTAVSTVAPKDEVIDAGVSPQHIYDVESVINPRQRGEELILMCVRRSGG